MELKNELIIVLDFGGQYNQLIARRVRECNVYAEIYPYTTDLDKIKELNPKGIIFTGGPNSVYGADSPTYTKEIFELGVPILGICYGSQLMAHLLGGKVQTAPISEYGRTEVDIDTNSQMFKNVDEKTVCWMSHTDYISTAPADFKVVATTPVCPVAAMECPEKNLYATQFHPEVMHTQQGVQMISNFVYNICKCTGTWKMDSIAEDTINKIREKVGDKRVLLGLSGGVDSSVVAALLSKAIGKQLTCVFVDHGLMRKDEGDEVESVFGPNGDFDLNFIRVNAKDRFLSELKGVEEPEAKRKIIGTQFVEVFKIEADKIGQVDFFAQGTIYPDTIESGSGKAAKIKTHHNLVDCVDFKELIEPLRSLFKDEVRKLGLKLGLPEYLVFRQPFPGPGLGVRIIGEITEEKIQTLQDADFIYRDEIAKAGLDKELAQYFAVLTNTKTVGVMGDERTYENLIALRAVKTSDFMTAEAAHIPWDVLDKIANRIVNEVKHASRIAYDCTGKPPATIEWE